VCSRFRDSAAGLDHLQHLEPRARQLSLTVEHGQNGFRRRFNLATLRGELGGTVMAQRILLELLPLTIRVVRLDP